MIRTIPDFKGARLRLGLSPAELATLMEKRAPFIQDIERGAVRDFSEAAQFVAALQNQFDAAIDAIVDADPPALVAYRTAEDFALYEPGWSQRLRSHHVWLAACAAARMELKTVRHIVWLDPEAYATWLKGRDDTETRRAHWAARSITG